MYQKPKSVIYGKLHSVMYSLPCASTLTMPPHWEDFQYQKAVRFGSNYGTNCWIPTCADLQHTGVFVPLFNLHSDVYAHIFFYFSIYYLILWSTKVSGDIDSTAFPWKRGKRTCWCRKCCTFSKTPYRKRKSRKQEHLWIMTAKKVQEHETYEFLTDTPNMYKSKYSAFLGANVWLRKAKRKYVRAHLRFALELTLHWELWTSHCQFT